MFGLLTLFLSSAVASESVVVVLVGPEGADPTALERVERHLTALGLEAGEVLAPRDLRDLVAVVQVPSRLPEAACPDGPMPHDLWLADLVAAERDIQLLRFLEAEGGLDRVTHRTVCLAAAPTGGELQRLHLAVARVHLLRSQITADAGEQSWHVERIHQALSAVARLGPDLAPPDSLEPELREVLKSLPLATPARLVAGGPLGRVTVDGRLVEGTPVLVPAGQHLLQAVGGKGVKGALITELSAGPVLLWAGSVPAGGLASEAETVVEGKPASGLLALVDPLLGRQVLLARVAADGTTDLVRTDGRRLPRIRAGASAEADLPAVVEPPAPARDGAGLRVGVAGAAGGTTLRVQSLAEPAGWLAGVRGWVGFDFESPVGLYLTVDVLAKNEALDEDAAWRLLVPVRVGARWYGPLGSGVWDVGLDGMVVGLGVVDGRAVFKPGGLAAAGLAFPLSDHLWLRTALALGGGAGWAIGDVGLGFEVR